MIPIRIMSNTPDKPDDAVTQVEMASFNGPSMQDNEVDLDSRTTAKAWLSVFVRGLHRDNFMTR